LRWIYISPHLDDAVLSCGGLIREQTLSKTRVEIWTICAGDPPESGLSPFAQALHTLWGTGLDTPALRRAEDITACQRIGARYRHLSFLDCIYRRSRDGNWLYPGEQSIFGELSAEDAPTANTLQTFLAASLKPDDVLVIPLTIGNHVDHQMVRSALEGLGRPLFYYADVPYVLEHPSQLSALTRDFQSQVYTFPPQVLSSWQESIQVYGSQMEVLFAGVEKMREAIHSYYQRDQGIRLWKSA
jgi:LmbE family N-acetylglucosaminyl deacetylase